MQNKYLSKRKILFSITVLIILIIGFKLTIHLYKNINDNTIDVTGEANNLFTDDYFINLTDITDIFRRLSIKDSDKINVICQVLSEVKLSEINVIEMDPPNVKVGHSIYQFNYSDGSKKIISILGRELIVNEGVYVMDKEINDTIRKQFE